MNIEERVKALLGNTLPSGLDPDLRAVVIQSVSNALKCKEKEIDSSKRKNRVLTISPQSGSVISRKSANAFLSMRQFLKGLASITMTGFTVYHVPLLAGPGILKMFLEARELSSIELTTTHMCILLAIKELSDNIGGWSSSEIVIERARLIAQNVPGVGVADINTTVLRHLCELRCVEMQNKKYRLKERIRIKNPRFVR